MPGVLTKYLSLKSTLKPRLLWCCVHFDMNLSQSPGSSDSNLSGSWAPLDSDLSWCCGQLDVLKWPQAHLDLILTQSPYDWDLSKSYGHFESNLTLPRWCFDWYLSRGHCDIDSSWVSWLASVLRTCWHALVLSLLAFWLWLLAFWCHGQFDVLMWTFLSLEPVWICSWLDLLTAWTWTRPEWSWLQLCLSLTVFSAGPWTSSPPPVSLWQLSLWMPQRAPPPCNTHTLTPCDSVCV